MKTITPSASAASRSLRQRETVFPAREAKARFAALAARAAAGETITISWHGAPRVRLVPAQDAAPVFRVDREWLRSMKVHAPASRAEDLIRADRDGRG